MPSFDLYKKMNSGVHGCGESHIKEASNIEEATWWDDPSSCVGYLYDYTHDNYKTQLDDFHPEQDYDKVPINVKFYMNQTQSLDTDAVSFHIQLMPSQETNVSYYDELFAKRYASYFPIGLYIDLPDSKGKYNRWLVVAGANINDRQFPTYDVLRCDYILQYVCNGIKYNVASVLRSQNS